MHLPGHADKPSQQGGRRLRNIEFVVEYGEAPGAIQGPGYTRIEKLRQAKTIGELRKPL